MPSLLRPPQAPPLVVAHRGASAHAPENTLPAFQMGWDAGVMWLETDVQPLGDGTLVLFHDRTLSRTTNRSGDLRDLSAQQLAEIDAGSWFNPTFGNTRIPTFEELLQNLPAPAKVFLEIKGHHSSADLTAIMSLIRRYDRTGDVYIQSVELDVLRNFRQLEPETPVGVIVELIDHDPVELCRELGAISYNPDFRELTQAPQVVDDLHTAGIAVIPWTSNDIRQWGPLNELGVDGIITDFPAQLLRWCERRWPDHSH